MLPLKYEIIMVPSNHSNEKSPILRLVKLSLLILFASFLVSVLCFFYGSLSKVITLPTIAIAIVDTLKDDSKNITITFR